MNSLDCSSNEAPHPPERIQKERKQQQDARKQFGDHCSGMYYLSYEVMEQLRSVAASGV
jgi:hypothetical protein